MKRTQIYSAKMWDRDIEKYEEVLMIIETYQQNNKIEMPIWSIFHQLDIRELETELSNAKEIYDKFRQDLIQAIKQKIQILEKQIEEL